MTASTSPSLLESVGAFVAGTPLEAIPAQARHQATLCVLDTIACMLAGARLVGVDEMIDAELEAGGPPECGVIGRSLRLPAEGAARVNGYMGDILELNDNTGGHASIAVVTAALAIAERRGSTGREFLRAVALGIEAVCRVHAGYYARIKPFTEAGLSPTNIPNAVGAAATAAVLGGFDAGQTARTLAIGATLASWSPAEAFFGDGGTIKPVLFGGWPAANAIRAARLAARGISGPRRVLESDIGYYATVARGYDADKVTSNEHWHVAFPRRKRHACCGYMHSALDVVGALRGELGAALAGASIEVRMPPNVIDAVSKGSTPPRTPDEARFHMEYCTTVVACGDPVIRPDHSLELARHLGRAEVESLLGRVRVVADPAKSHYEQSEVTVLVPGAAPIVRQGGPALGAPSHPMSDAQLVEKFDQLAAPESTPAQRAAYVERLLALESQHDTGWLVGTFAGRP